MSGKLLGVGQVSPQIQMVAPLNDVQLVALVTGMLQMGNSIDSVETSVSQAMSIVAESVFQMQGNALADMVRSRMEKCDKT